MADNAAESVSTATEEKSVTDKTENVSIPTPSPTATKKTPVERPAGRTSTSRSRLPRPTLHSVQEVELTDVPPKTVSEQDSIESGKSSSTCPDVFGVRSYLHNFYETAHVKEPHLYEDARLLHENDDFRYLVTPKRRRCVSLWWKVGVWCGINLVVLGLIAVVVGYLVPPRPVVVAALADDLHIIDNSAIKFNANLDACKLTGLIIFCTGGVLVALALLFPSLMSRYHDDVELNGRLSSEPFGVQMHLAPPRSPTDLKVPVTESVRHIQPVTNAR